MQDPTIARRVALVILSACCSWPASGLAETVGWNDISGFIPKSSEQGLTEESVRSNRLAISPAVCAAKEGERKAYSYDVSYVGDLCTEDGCLVDQDTFLCGTGTCNGVGTTTATVCNPTQFKDTSTNPAHGFLSFHSENISTPSDSTIPAFNIGDDDRITIPTYYNAENDAHSEALSALEAKLNEPLRYAPSGQVRPLWEVLEDRAHSMGSLILQDQDREWATTDSGDTDRIISTSTFASARSRKEKHELGENFFSSVNAVEAIGMMVTASPFGAGDDKLKVSLSYLNGSEVSDSPDDTEIDNRRASRALSPDPQEDEHFSLYNTKWHSEVVSAAVESYLAEGKLWIRGETAGSMYDSDVSDTQNDKIQARAHYLMADWTLLESSIRDNKLNWSVGFEDQNADPQFRSPGNFSVLGEGRTQNWYSSLSVGNLLFTASLGVDTWNASDSGVEPGERERWNSFSTVYRAKSSNGWLGKLILGYEYGNSNSSEIDAPAGYTDDLYAEGSNYHAVSASMKYSRGSLKLSYNQSSIDDLTEENIDRELRRTSLRASYRVFKALNVFGRLSHRLENDLSLDDDAREWKSSQGFSWKVRNKSLSFQYGLSDFNALTGSEDRESNTLSTKFSWDMNPRTRLLFRGDNRNSSNNNDSVRVLFGLEINQKSLFQ